MSPSVIIDAVRSPIGVKWGNMAHNIRPDDLTAKILKALLERNPDFDVNHVEDVVLGCGYPEGSQGMLLARSTSVLAGVPVEAGAKVVNRLCGSSMDAVHQLSRAIEVGDIDAGIAAGVEDMFTVPRGGFNPDRHPQLEKQSYYIEMGMTAENLAEELDISREKQEAFAVASHEKALSSQAEGRFENELVPLELEDGTLVDQDEGPQTPDMEKIRSLRPAFSSQGTVTAATSSPFSIGAGAALVTSRRFADVNGLSIRAEIVSRAVAGVEWERMGMGPLPSTEKALQFAGLTMADMDLIELNEAFAAQALYVVRKGKWLEEKINLNGGAIALGHPLGCSGVRILTTLINVMEQKNAEHGLATMCIGKGQGISTILRRS
ncbi:MAG: acetyl-CoA C-acyltransferase [Candidatus Marinimicrobia bacterium]|nr:acetyl-CoA C-acyltransferase [Candidatus Neomarinimicrobiota bacterium]